MKFAAICEDGSRPARRAVRTLRSAHDCARDRPRGVPSARASRGRRDPWERSRRHRSTTKCTEPVAPSSGFPTDCRRSGRRSESHQPRTLRTRCIADSRGCPWGRQGIQIATLRKLRSFLFTPGRAAPDGVCSSRSKRQKGPRRRDPGHEFAEPGTLSSTFPTNLPLPRSAPRGASSYRRPVLGAGRNLRHGTCPIKGVDQRKFTQIAAGGSLDNAAVDRAHVPS
jgi:hypothetical protein